MKKNYIISLLLISGLFIMFFSNCGNKQKKSSFSFNEIIEANKNIPLPKADFFKSSDGVDIAYYPFIPGKNTKAAVIFIHGGGAYSEAGYQKLAADLKDKHNVSVYLMDIRGHGNSGGPRGDSPTVQQVWEDLKLFIQFVKNKNPKTPLFLAGHSSGGGLILNYLSWFDDNSIKGYIFISPEFGYKSKTARKDRTNFAKVKISVFIKNGIFKGKYGNTKAVFFNYPEEILKSQPKMINFITCNMSIALTPDVPFEQFKKINKPFGLFVGSNDELFIPEKIISFSDLASKEIKERSLVRIIEGKKHLSILIDAGELIIDAIEMINNYNK